MIKFAQSGFSQLDQFVMHFYTSTDLNRFWTSFLLRLIYHFRNRNLIKFLFDLYFPEAVYQ